MLDHNNIGTEGLDNLMSGLAMSPTLTHLSLSYCGLGPKSAISLQLLVAFVDTKISYLNLEGNELGQDGNHNILFLSTRGLQVDEGGSYQYNSQRIKSCR